MSAPWDPTWHAGPVDRIRALFERQYAGGPMPIVEFRRMLSELNSEWTGQELDGLVEVSRMSNDLANWRLFTDWLAFGCGSHFEIDEMESLRRDNASLRRDNAALRQQNAEQSAKLKMFTDDALSDAPSKLTGHDSTLELVEKPQLTLAFTSLGRSRTKADVIKKALSKFWQHARGETDESEETRVLRQNFFTGRWTLYIAGGKAKKPLQYGESDRSVPRATDQPTYCEICPFCPGCEQKTPDSLLIIDKDGGMHEGDDDLICQPCGKWSVRVIPNIFPTLITPSGAYGDSYHKKLETLPHSSVASGKHSNAFTFPVPFESLSPIEKDSTRQTDAIGYSEVVIEDTVHNALLGISTPEQAALALRALQHRGRVLRSKPGVQMLFYFKQYGPLSGGSLVHPHMQVCTSPVLAPEFQTRLDLGSTFYKEHGCCAACRNLVEEPTGKTNPGSLAPARLVAESDHFVASVPFASGKKYRVSICPKVHEASWLEVDQERIEDLAWILQLVMEGFYYGFDDPSYNFYIFSVDRDELLDTKDYRQSAHWTLEILPRFPADLGGLELASGIRCLNGMPADHARELRAAVEARLALRPSTKRT